MNGKRSERNCGHKQNGKLGSRYILLSISDMTRKPSRWPVKNKAKNEIKAKKAAPGVSPGGRAARKCPSLVSGVLLSHGLTPQYHRRWGA